MRNEEIQTAISNFYRNNHIDYKKYTDDMKACYENNLKWDPKIYKPNLEAALYEWLNNFEDEDKTIYLRMFEHFTYLTQHNFEYKVWCLKEYIFEVLSEYPKDKILIVFSESKTGNKSGASEMSAAWWKACCGQMRKSQLIMIHNKVKKEEIIGMEAIVFMDDIVATGFSLKAVIEGFFGKFPYCEFKETKFYATGVLATQRGRRTIRELEKKGIHVTWRYDPNAFLCQAFKGGYIFGADEKQETEKAVLKYEKKIGIDEDGKSYVMGYEASKLLVGFHYEIPNNTLCTFWRYGENHVPLFERSSNQKFSLEEIRNRKTMMRDNAYKMKSLKRSK